ncbi:hypothetical protein KIN20_023235 [Parelaphostrongylus tenuis]|uniref:Uncharacterized protein n=1 Tax=Parelaphostrongylus tenuis TaxID=148309 RepID=A0AAD5QVA2_PARTN|nr:hypothetical protein KIN20_023235 [Parelaphostrongylus tenuis]
MTAEKRLTLANVTKINCSGENCDNSSKVAMSSPRKRFAAQRKFLVVATYHADRSPPLSAIFSPTDRRPSAYIFSSTKKRLNEEENPTEEKLCLRSYDLAERLAEIKKICRTVFQQVYHLVYSLP